MTAANNLRTSKLLRELLEQHQGDQICLSDLLRQMNDRAFGFLLLICALPEILPLPPVGFSAIVGIPLMLVSAQLALGRDRPWLPDWIANRPFSRAQVEKQAQRIFRQLEKLEHLLKPRWPFFTQPIVERLIGLLVLVLALVIALPIPFGNFLPAIAIITISLGMIEKDGRAIAVGCLSAGVILLVMASAIVLALRALSVNFTPS